MLAKDEVMWLAESDAWFASTCARRTQLSLRAGYRQPKTALCWFKDTAKEHLHRIRALVALLQEHGVAVEVRRLRSPGYIVYEDEHQVAAVPFGVARRKDNKRRIA